VVENGEGHGAMRNATALLGKRPGKGLEGFEEREH
jgi:hypothetical protein